MTFAHRLVLLPLALAAFAFPGCVEKRPHGPATTQPVTELDPKVATAEYWLAQPAAGQVVGRDFMNLWETAEQVARDYLFRIDRRDYRGGVLATEPMISKQIFEFWRRDSGTALDAEEATLGTIRRTIYFQFAQNLDNTYTVTPKVVVERLSKRDPTIPREEDVPGSYWYALRRDTVMEGKLVASLRKKLNIPAPAEREERPEPVGSPYR